MNGDTESGLDVDWLILADSAQVVGQKLYLLGGGWDRLTLPQPPPVHHQMAIAAAFKIPWNDANQKHRFEIEIADGDGEVVGKIGGDFEVGRPAGTPPGQDLRTQIAVNVGLNIKKIGAYQLTARLNGQYKRHFVFNVFGGSPN